MSKYIILSLFIVITQIVLGLRDKSDENQENSYNSDEDEADALILGKKLATPFKNKKGKADKEIIIEKFIDSLVSSERYLALMERKLNHLDISFHEKSSNIMNYLTEMMKKIKPQPTAEVEATLKGVTKDLEKFKHTIIDKVTMMPHMRGKFKIDSS